VSEVAGEEDSDVVEIGEVDKRNTNFFITKCAGWGLGILRICVLLKHETMQGIPW